MVSPAMTAAMSGGFTGKGLVQGSSQAKAGVDGGQIGAEGFGAERTQTGKPRVDGQDQQLIPCRSHAEFDLQGTGHPDLLCQFACGGFHLAAGVFPEG
jgi:hypothetical protein